MNKSNYIGLAYQFFNLAREAITEMEKQGNKSLIISNGSSNDEDSWVEYEHNTRWNDFNIGVPVLFNFYHGLELLMKGLLQEIGNNQKVTNHTLSEHFQSLQNHPNKISNELTSILQKYIFNQNPFNDFFLENEVTPDKFYQLLKYPESLKGESYNFSRVRGNENIGLLRFLEVKRDIINLRNAIIKWKTHNNVNL